MASLLVLWDVDYTLINAGAAGRRLYEIAFAQMFGGLPPQLPSMAGRTDRAISLELLARAGAADPAGPVDAWEQLLAARAPEVREFITSRGRVLPGAASALAAMSTVAGVVQSVLTGNIRALADVKLEALGLLDHLDLESGAYGSVSADRADLVPVARAAASRRHGADFAGTRTVLVGDTPLDVAAALAAGARAVAVATGSFSAAALAAAGAQVVLPDLTDTSAVLAAILGPPAG